MLKNAFLSPPPIIKRFVTIVSFALEYIKTLNLKVIMQTFKKQSSIGMSFVKNMIEELTTVPIMEYFHGVLKVNSKNFRFL